MMWIIPRAWRSIRGTGDAAGGCKPPLHEGRTIDDRPYIGTRRAVANRPYEDGRAAQRRPYMGEVK